MVNYQPFRKNREFSAKTRYRHFKIYIKGPIEIRFNQIHRISFCSTSSSRPNHDFFYSDGLDLFGDREIDHYASAALAVQAH
jgi:hypothetical protein